jgi:tetratricopeptide (TPR) repeat protein
VISERSTLTSLRSPTVSRTLSTRGSSLGPHEPITRTVSYPRTTYTTHSTDTYWWSGGYYSGYYGWPYYYSGFSFGLSFNIGPFYFGIGYSYPYYRSYYGGGWYSGSSVYFGSFAAAYLVGTAWHIVPYSNVGWWGYNYGSRCYWFPRNHWRRYHRYHYHGHYCRVYRPYWYGYTRWYDYRPYSYGYSSYVYDSIYDDGYDDGYYRGYRRGYETGAEDASAYRDDRRRDEIGKEPRPRVPDSDIDKAKTDAATEYRYEMNRGTEAFENGDYKTATRAYKEALILSPNSADARYSLAVSAFAEGKYAFAAFALRRGVSLDAEAGQFDVRAAFRDPVVFDGFVESLQSELSEYPDDPDLLLLSGWVDLRTGDYSSAAAKLDRAVANAPQDGAAKVLQREALDKLEEE